MEEIKINIQETPNPNSWKFVCNRLVRSGDVSVHCDVKEDWSSVPLVQALFTVGNLLNVHLFEKSISVTKEAHIDFDDIVDSITDFIKEYLPYHDPDFDLPKQEEEKEELLYDPEDPDIMAIEKILDDQIRTYLRLDGGDCEIVSYGNNMLILRYQGACGTCPSSITGTLMAIEDILKREFNPDLVVKEINNLF